MASLADSLWELQAIYSGKSDSRNDLLNELLLVTTKLMQLDVTIVITWILVHVGTASNEEVDKQAKSTINSECTDLGIPWSKLEFKHLNKSVIRKEWQELWVNKKRGKDREKGAQQLKTLIFSKALRGRAKRILTGHCRLNSNLFLINMHKDGLCITWKAQKMIDHILWDCKDCTSERKCLYRKLGGLKITFSLQNLARIQGK